jgi:hypothetical protein
VYPPGKPDSVNVVVHVVRGVKVTDTKDPTATGLEGEDEGVYVVVQPALELESVGTV